MIDPILLGSTLTDDEFKHIFELTSLIKYPAKDTCYFWVLSNLTIGCSPLRPHQDFSNLSVLTMDEFLAYIKEHKLLRILE